MNIFQRLNEVRKEVQYLQKDKKVENYMAVTHDMVTAHLRPHFIQHGIFVTVNEMTSHLENTGKTTSKGTPITRFMGSYEVSFINMDEPEDKVSITLSSIAEDTADKGPGKAISYAVKYAFLKIFNIETGESEESRIPAEQTFITEEQVNTLHSMISDNGLQEDVVNKFLSWLGVGDITEISTKDYQKALAALDGKIKQMKKEGKDANISK